MDEVTGQDRAPGDRAQRRREELAAAFTVERSRLVSLAYRLTGSLTDAEDVAQESWIRLQRAAADPATAPRDLPAWLTTTATRLALDQLRAAGRRKETYVGPWLPEPRVAPGHARGRNPEDTAALADEVSSRFWSYWSRCHPRSGRHSSSTTPSASRSSRSPWCSGGRPRRSGSSRAAPANR